MTLYPIEPVTEQEAFERAAAREDGRDEDFYLGYEYALEDLGLLIRKPHAPSKPFDQLVEEAIEAAP